MSEKLEQPKSDLEKLKEQMAQMAKFLQEAVAREEKQKEFQETIDEFNRIQAEVEAGEKPQIGQETVERLKKEMEEMEKKFRK